MYIPVIQRSVYPWNFVGKSVKFRYKIHIIRLQLYFYIIFDNNTSSVNTAMIDIPQPSWGFRWKILNLKLFPCVIYIDNLAHCPVCSLSFHRLYKRFETSVCHPVIRIAQHNELSGTFSYKSCLRFEYTHVLTILYKPYTHVGMFLYNPSDYIHWIVRRGII